MDFVHDGPGNFKQSLSNAANNINYNFLKLRIHNFLLQAGCIPITVFGTTASRQLGYSAITVGGLYTALPLITSVMKPLICSIADRFKLRKAVFLLTVVGAIMCNVFMVFLPKREVETNVTFSCSENGIAIFSTVGQTNEFSKTDGRITCQLRCQRSDELVRSLCFNWQLNEFCGNVNDSIIREKVINFNCVTSSVIHKNNYLYSEVVSASVQNVDNFTFNGCSNNWPINNISCKMQCNDDLFTEAFNSDSGFAVQYYQFWCLALIFILSWVSVSTNMSITDTACYSLLDKDNHKYGTIRLFGSAGFGVSSIVCGWLVDFFSTNNKFKNYTPLYIFAASLYTVDIFICYFIKVKQDVTSVAVLQGIRKLYSNFRVIVFALCCIYVGMAMSIYWVFLYWYLEDISTDEELKWSKTLQGLDCLIVTIVSEVPVIYFSGHIIRKIGIVKVVPLTFLALTIRYFLFGLLVRPIWVLPIELFAGFCYGFFYVVITTYANAVSPPGLEATTQSMFSVCLDGIGSSLGSLIGGFLFDEYKGSITFFIFSFISFIVFVIFNAAQYITHFTVHTNIV